MLNPLKAVSNEIPLVDKWLISQLFPTFILFAIGFTVFSISLGSLLHLIQMIFSTSLTFTGAVKIVFYKLPGYFVISLPMSCLLTNLSVFGNLKESNELLALRSLGFNIRRYIFAGVLIGLLASILTFSINNLVVPESNRLSELTLRKELGVTNDINLAKDVIFSNFDKNNYLKEDKSKLMQLFYAQIYENKEMKDVTLVDYSNQNLINLITANSALFDLENNQWTFFDGEITSQSISNNELIIKKSFEKYSLTQGVLGAEPIKIAKTPKDSNNMSLSKALRAKKLYKDSGNMKELRKIKVRINEKFAFPLVCLIFSLAGGIIGSLNSFNSSQSQSFGLSIIIIISYYTLAFLFSSLGVSGTLNPLLAAWSPIAIFGLISEITIRKYS